MARYQYLVRVLHVDQFLRQKVDLLAGRNADGLVHLGDVESLMAT